MAPAWARRWRWRCAVLAAGPGAFGALGLACVRAPRMCVAEAGCAAGSTCVAGRCLARGASPAIATASRSLFDPVDAVFLAPGQPPASDGVSVLGRGDGAMALYRFAIPLAPDVSVVEAYLLLECTPGVDADPSPVLLHTARLVGEWDSRSLSWARQPPLEAGGAAETWVTGAARSVVRLEVRPTIERWRERRRDDLGLAVLAQGHNPTGVTFALPARLELYVK